MKKFPSEKYSNHNFTSSFFSMRFNLFTRNLISSHIIKYIRHKCIFSSFAFIISLRIFFLKHVNMRSESLWICRHYCMNIRIFYIICNDHHLASTCILFLKAICLFWINDYFSLCVRNYSNLPWFLCPISHLFKILKIC